jgi:tRNA threonylcarbamoyladenosine biosynthesis protein TsaE
MTPLLSLETTSPARTHAFASQWAACLQPGNTVALYGDIGAGKTHFTQGLAHGLGVANAKRTGLSPTYALVHTYPAKQLTLVHIDLYRLANLQAAYDMGLEELIGQPHTLTVIEWAQRIPEIIPKNAYHVELTSTGPRSRLCNISRLP